MQHFGLVSFAYEIAFATHPHSMVYSFLLLDTIPLYGCTMLISPQTCWLLLVWGNYVESGYKYSYTSFCVNMFSAYLIKYLGVQLLGCMIHLCLAL